MSDEVRAGELTTEPADEAHKLKRRATKLAQSLMLRRALAPPGRGECAACKT